MFIVDNYGDFISDHSWVNVFGEIIPGRLPDKMVVGAKSADTFAWYNQSIKPANWF